MLYNRNMRLRLPFAISGLSLLLVLVACGGSGAIDGNVQGAYSFPLGKGGTTIDPSFSAVETDAFSITGPHDVQVTSLGIELADPSQSVRQVALFDSGGNILATTMVSTSDQLIDGYFYKAISPVTLISGRQYFIGELHIAGTMDSYTWNTNVATTPSYIRDIGTCYCATGSITNGMSFSTPGTPRHYSASFQSRQIVP